MNQTVTWEDLEDLGFVFGKSDEWWVRSLGNVDVTVDLNHNAPLVHVGSLCEPYAPRFDGVRSRADLETLLKLIGEPQ